MSQNKPMDPEQAISLLDQVCAQVSLTRENHQRVLVAVGVMRNGIKNGHDAREPKKAIFDKRSDEKGSGKDDHCDPGSDSVSDKDG